MPRPPSSGVQVRVTLVSRATAAHLLPKLFRRPNRNSASVKQQLLSPPPPAPPVGSRVCRALLGSFSGDGITRCSSLCVRPPPSASHSQRSSVLEAGPGPRSFRCLKDAPSCGRSTRHASPTLPCCIFGVLPLGDAANCHSHGPRVSVPLPGPCFQLLSVHTWEGSGWGSFCAYF